MCRYPASDIFHYTVIKFDIASNNVNGMFIRRRTGSSNNFQYYSLNFDSLTQNCWKYSMFERKKINMFKKQVSLLLHVVNFRNVLSNLATSPEDKRSVGKTELWRTNEDRVYGIKINNKWHCFHENIKIIDTIIR